jgi:mannose-6-phosphate isomerase-like protein (cupin superfamily)
VARPTGAGSGEAQVVEHDGEVLFWFVLTGAVGLSVDARREELHQGDAVAIPAGTPHGFEGWTDGLELLEVTLPAQYTESVSAAVVDARR